MEQTFTTILVVGFSAKNLPQKDIGSQNDTYIKFSSTDGQHFRTSVIMDENNPQWSERFDVKFAFERVVKCTVELYDKDEVTADDKIGEVTFSLAELACQGSLTLTLSKGGTITIFGEEKAEAKEVCCLSLTASNIPKRGAFQGKRKPFLAISREIGNIKTRVFSSKPDVGSSILSCTASVSDRELYGSDPSGRFMIELWDHHESKDDVLMASERFNWVELYSEACGDMDKPSKQVNRKLGPASLSIGVSRERRMTLVDYIQAGLMFNLVCAIDYSGSNGHWQNATSLHNFDPSINKSSPYENAMIAAANVLMPYNPRQAISMFGYGAKVPFLKNETSHCFPILPNAENSEAIGIEEMIRAYREMTPTLQFWGPTYFHEIIGRSSEYARSSFDFAQRQGGLTYTIMLLLTDGVVSSMEKAIESIVSASDSPLSIVILGIGNEDFTEMEILDGDGTTLVAKDGRASKRDLVQFVEASKYIKNGQVDMANLAADVLREVPDQMREFMRMKNVTI